MQPPVRLLAFTCLEPSPQPDESPETEALRAVAAEIVSLRSTLKPTPLLGGPTLGSMREMLTGETAAEGRERGRVKREKDQAKLYRMVVIFAAISAIASVASVVVAALNA